MDYNHLKDYYKAKKVFLTGHTGFKGSWMLLCLDILGAEVKGYALAPETAYDLYPSVGGDNLCHSVIADIRDKERLEKEILDFQPDYIFHLAAQPLVRLSYKIPSETFAVNAIGTANVLESVNKLKKRCEVICITTDKVYENLEWHYPYRESDRLGGFDPYSASKACAELIINSFRQSFFSKERYNIHNKSLCSVRAGNVIGGGDWAEDRIIPDIIRSLKDDKTINIRNPFAIRPWQHVMETIAAYLHIGSKLLENPTQYSEAWNIGPQADDNRTVEKLVQEALSVWGKGIYETPKLENQPHEAGLLKLDINKSTNELKWMPKYNSEKAIRITIDWYKKVIIGKLSAKQITQEQIKEYLFG
ncbi:MAG: CDP-glucose 4,6-dehydratase [Saprospiraceae bacterium]